MGADPDLTHIAPRLAVVAEDAGGDVDGRGCRCGDGAGAGIPTEPGQAGKAIQRFDGFELVESDLHDAARDEALIIGQFLIDRDGIVRWINIEQEPGELLSHKRLASAVNSL